MHSKEVSPPDGSQAHFNVNLESRACVHPEVLICELLVFKNISKLTGEEGRYNVFKQKPLLTLVMVK